MVNRTSIVLAGLLFVLAGAFGCGDNGFGVDDSGEIQVEPEQIGFSQVEIGDSEIQMLRIRNRANDDPLTVHSIDLTEGEDGHIGQLEIVDKPDLETELEPDEFLEVEVEYEPEQQTPPNQGQIEIQSSDPGGQVDVPVLTLGNNPEFFPEPAQVRFQRLSPGDSSEQELRVTNIGSGPLVIYEEPTYSGGNAFHLVESDRDYPIELWPYDPEAAVENPEDYQLTLDVLYQPADDVEESGTILFETNDVADPPPAEGESRTQEVPVLADAEAPCIEVDSRTRNFGQIPFGELGQETITVGNCGTETLEINEVLLEDDEDTDFSLELGPWDATGDGSVDSPVSIEPDESQSFIAEFAPEDEEGTQRADVEILSNDPIQPVLEIELIARGAEGTCPEAVATATVDGTPMNPSPSITAAPLDTVVLDGTESTDEDGDIVDWQWTALESPPGVDIDLEAVEDDESVMEFQPLTAGDYRVGLEVLDDSGFHSCEMAEVEISAIPQQNIHVELTWTNPADPGTTDDGSDLDLHLVKLGPGEWFGSDYSVFFQYPNEDGENIWDPEDPSLDIDIRDGEGPENITMETPDHCQWYGIGVHYYDTHGFGTAYATIRVYINGDLRYERPYFQLDQTGEFWDAARIHWDEETSDATILPVDGFYPFAPNEEEPAVTDAMIESDLCTAENLY